MPTSTATVSASSITSPAGTTSPAGRILAAACLIATGLAGVLTTVLLPPAGEGDDVASIDRFAAHAGRVDAGLAVEALVVLLGAATAIAALLAFPRSRRLASVGGWLGIISGGAWIGLVSTDNVRAAAAEHDHAAGAALMQTMSESAQFQVFVALSLLGGLVSMVCLGIALWRSRAIPRWAAATFVLYQPVNFAGGGSGAVGTVANALMLVGFAACAVTILRAGLPALAVGASQAGSTTPARAAAPSAPSTPAPAAPAASPASTPAH